MTYEAASSAAAAAAIRPCAVSDASALQPRLRDAYFHDSYRLPVDDQQCPALGLFLRATDRQLLSTVKLLSRASGADHERLRRALQVLAC